MQMQDDKDFIKDLIRSKNLRHYGLHQLFCGNQFKLIILN
jgi:hypothetical protein